MSIEHMAVVLHHSKAKGTDKLILLGVANHQGDGGAHPGMATLARYGNVGIDAARESVRRLEACPAPPGAPCPTPRKDESCPHLGELVVHLGEGKATASGRTNRYEVVVTCPPGCDRSPNHKLSKTPAPEGVKTPAPEGVKTPAPEGANQPLNRPSTTPQPPKVPQLPESLAQLWGGEGISSNEQQQLWLELVNDPDTHVPVRRGREPAWYVPTVAKIRAREGKALGQAITTVRRFGQPCEHDEPGGADPHPVTGLPLCPLCRVKARQ